MTSLRNSTAICGVGLTPMVRRSDTTKLDWAVQGFKAALDDAGLKKSDIDGLMMPSFGADYDRFLDTVGLDVRYAYQGWSHGRFLSAMIAHAAMAVHHGLANTIAIVHGSKVKPFGSPSSDHEIWRQGLGPHGESPANGAVAPALGVATSARRYFHLYGGGNEALAPIAVAFRQNARLNPNAMMTEPMTIADHQASPWIIDPLRRLDCCQGNEGGACIIITSTERARDMAKRPVPLMGIQGIHAGPQYQNFSLPGLGIGQQEVFTYQPDDLSVYKMAGIERSDVDSLAVYDAFTPVVLFSLERFGFCGPGEAMDFVKDGRLAVGGALPTNTAGGLLSEGHANAYNHLAEIVRQLRHECGPRQVKDAEIIQWANFLGDSMIFGRDN